jgi:hypothetical protein
LAADAGAAAPASAIAPTVKASAPRFTITATTPPRRRS